MAQDYFASLGYMTDESHIEVIFDYPETGSKYRLSMPTRYYNKYNWIATMPFNQIESPYWSREWYQSLPLLTIDHLEGYRGKPK